MKNIRPALSALLLAALAAAPVAQAADAAAPAAAPAAESTVSSDSELLAAARWVLGQDAGEVFPGIVRDALRLHDYANIADQI